MKVPTATVAFIGSLRLRGPQSSLWRLCSTPGNPSGGTPEGSEEVVREPPPLPPKGSKMTAFEYFNHPYFFRSEEDREAFVKWFEEGTKIGRAHV